MNDLEYYFEELKLKHIPEIYNVNGGQEFPIFGGLKIHHLTIFVKSPKVVKYARN
jgi:hypothetical protein